MQETWRLRVLNGQGTMFEVCGLEEMLRIAFDEWKERKTNPEIPDNKLFEVTGWCDTSDRAEYTICLSMEDTVGVSLVRLY